MSAALINRKARQRAVKTLMPWLAAVLLIALWQGIAVGFNTASVLLPSPVAVARALFGNLDVIWPYALHTLWTTALGFLLAVAFGLLLGMAIGASPLLYSGIYPLLIAFNAVPKVALVPIFVLWFGIGAVPAAITAFSLAIFPIVVNVATGLATIDTEMEDVMRSLGASRLQILVKVGIPRMMPYLFASLKIAITLAFVGSVLSETIASNQGVGYLMQAASARFDVPLLFAGLVVIAVMAVLAYVSCVLVESRLTRWTIRKK